MREMHKLSAREVDAANEVGRYADGGGLYLQVSPGGSKQWLFRYMINNRARAMGLGSVDTFTLKEARERARDFRKLVADKIDPIEHRLSERDKLRADEASRLTFKDAADRYIQLHEGGWKNAKHRQQWRNTLSQYVFPKLGARPVAALDTAVINDALASIWTTIPDTAARVRGRVQTVVRWVRDGMPLPRQSSQRGDNQPALPYEELPAFMDDLRSREGTSARALEFQILTASRPGAVAGARWEEIDLNAQVWTISASRLGTKLRDKDHRVPLTKRAIEILESLPREKGNPHLFIGGKSGRPLSDMALNTTVRRMNKDRERDGLPLYVDPSQNNRPIVPHGFRSTFRDWTAERTSYPNHVAEMALAHVIGNKSEAAYRRGDLLDKRRKLMEAWAGYCASRPVTNRRDNVTALRAV